MPHQPAPPPPHSPGELDEPSKTAGDSMPRRWSGGGKMPAPVAPANKKTLSDELNQMNDHVNDPLSPRRRSKKEKYGESDGKGSGSPHSNHSDGPTKRHGELDDKISGIGHVHTAIARNAHEQVDDP